MASTSSNPYSVALAISLVAVTVAWGGTVGLLVGMYASRPPATSNTHVENETRNGHRDREGSVSNAGDAKIMDKHALVDVRIGGIRALIPPVCLLEQVPRTVAIARTVNKGRQEVNNILRRVDDRLVVVVGPCSIHDPKAALEYAVKLKALRDTLDKDLLVVMRVYFEKPRTTVGWKGLINDPDIDGTFNINKGLRLARELLSAINELGLPVGSLFSDLLVQLAVDAVVSAAHPHSFLGVSSHGLSAIVTTNVHIYTVDSLQSNSSRKA
ncbi:hypothetical protein DYB25_010044 [Aphanomyces astaci]|uniref:3-deoxy-7-phosphoheptulonate synthase n=2 Tax=Aphanomyces astaci TaxID=112090 RepID=A0A397F2B7_APHAT|nr:hypothetical protein DYB36_002783 [Aphanomyces astaci]RHY38218.1 hypothetical protein DYB25_010044 [Aphanomyces astaci]RHY63574.1 hypothetical protein DYB30_002189 [Aphanomyces astaci]RHZ08301.1 hypothetical protein DYB31_012106 [Aphanomyces astaci]